MILLFFFFFQAEDGIRDTSVTGVQTCALPIYGLPRLPRPLRLPPCSHTFRDTATVSAVPTHRPLSDTAACTPSVTGMARSEERRVGKECRSGRAPDYEKETDTD